MYQRILVAVDGSETSSLALREAIGLAKDQGARLRIAHVIDEVTINWEGGFGIEDVRESFRKEGRDMLERARHAARDASVDCEVRLLEIETLGHRVTDLIVQEAKRWPADLIVVGSHGRRGLHRLLLGSAAEGVMRGATVPVLLVHAR